MMHQRVTDTTGVESIKAQAIAGRPKRLKPKRRKPMDNSCPDELKADMNEHKMKPMFETSAQAIQCCRNSFLKLPSEGGFFDASDEWHKLAKENLLTDFVLCESGCHSKFFCH